MSADWGIHSSTTTRTVWVRPGALGNAMEVMELFAVDVMTDEFDEDCPYKEDGEGVAELEIEDLLVDDTEDAEKQQHSNGGVLGKNLASGSQGKSGTVGGPCSLAKAKEDERRDTRRKRIQVMVPGTDAIPDGVYGFTVAAHHLIPGDAALSKSKLYDYMIQDKTVEVRTSDSAKPKKKTIEKHIGYNVNGAHNGVWLPGNYYIRKRTSPKRGKSWLDLGNDPWCLNYVAAVSKVASGQIHDAHTEYSSSVLNKLNDVALVLGRHECKYCKKPKINPPFRLKARLYILSDYLRGQVKNMPQAWKRPWFTSDRWRTSAFSGGAPSKKFNAAYNAAKTVTR